jgi:pyrroline-5-carboxylate reductase
VRAIILEAGVQAAMKEGLDRAEAERIARTMLRRWWGWK